MKVFKYLILTYTLVAEIHKGFRFQGPAGKGLPAASDKYTVTNIQENIALSFVQLCISVGRFS